MHLIQVIRRGYHSEKRRSGKQKDHCFYKGNLEQRCHNREISLSLSESVQLELDAPYLVQDLHLHISNCLLGENNWTSDFLQFPLSRRCETWNSFMYRAFSIDNLQLVCRLQKRFHVRHTRAGTRDWQTHVSVAILERGLWARSLIRWHVNKPIGRSRNESSVIYLTEHISQLSWRKCPSHN